MSKQTDKYNFFQDVYEVVKLIPKGRVTSYGAIAKYLGAPNKSRQVGYAMHGAVSTMGVPAHRVVNRNGELTGASHFPPERPMEALLQAEGVEVVNGRIQQFKSIYWDPVIELAL